jgi:hypothetical protein
MILSRSSERSGYNNRGPQKDAISFNWHLKMYQKEKLQLVLIGTWTDRQTDGLSELIYTSVNSVHNAPVELPPARSFPARAPHPARSFLTHAPRPVLHQALPSPTPQNTPQGTGANGITPQKKKKKEGTKEKGAKNRKK